MLDIKFIRDNKDLVAEAARKKHINFDVETLLAVDMRRLEILAKVEEMRARQNKASKDITSAKDATLRQSLIGEMKALKDELGRFENQLKDIMKEWQLLMLAVPNVPDMSVPEGTSDADNKEVRRWGELPEFSFSAKSHIALMEVFDMADFARGAKSAGFRGYFLKGYGAILSFAIWRLILDELVLKGFTPMIAPSLVRREAFLGTGYLPHGEEDLYKTQDGDFLSGTAEVPTMAYYMDEVIPMEALPKKFVSFSPCFRREAGSHGKDTKGLMRVHEFFKLEQVVLCEANHEISVEHHEELTLNAEAFMQKLEIPYRVVLNCGGDLGLGQVKKYDIEAWVPSENTYRETHSSSYFHDFQTRRLNIKYRDAGGTLRFAHSLNNTAIATPRILISLIENHQQADGSIKIPEALQKYVGKDVLS